MTASNILSMTHTQSFIGLDHAQLIDAHVGHAAIALLMCDSNDSIHVYNIIICLARYAIARPFVCLCHTDESVLNG